MLKGNFLHFQGSSICISIVFALSFTFVFVFVVRWGLLWGIGGSVFLPGELSATGFGVEEQLPTNPKGWNLPKICQNILVKGVQ